MAEPSINCIFDNDAVAPDRTVSRRLTPVKLTIREQFEQFHADNPFVYTLLCRFARMVKAKGIHRYSMQGLFERLRWHVEFESYEYTPGKFKLNNNFCSHYSRLLMDREPDLHGMFSLRVLKAA